MAAGGRRHVRPRKENQCPALSLLRASHNSAASPLGCSVPLETWISGSAGQPITVSCSAGAGSPNSSCAAAVLGTEQHPAPGGCQAIFAVAPCCWQAKWICCVTRALDRLLLWPVRRPCHLTLLCVNGPQAVARSECTALPSQTLLCAAAGHSGAGARSGSTSPVTGSPLPRSRHLPLPTARQHHHSCLQPDAGDSPRPAQLAAVQTSPGASRSSWQPAGAGVVGSLSSQTGGALGASGVTAAGSARSEWHRQQHTEGQQPAPPLQAHSQGGQARAAPQQGQACCKSGQADASYSSAQAGLRAALRVSSASLCSLAEPSASEAAAAAAAAPPFLGQEANLQDLTAFGSAALAELEGSGTPGSTSQPAGRHALAAACQSGGIADVSARQAVARGSSHLGQGADVLQLAGPLPGPACSMQQHDCRGPQPDGSVSGVLPEPWPATHLLQPCLHRTAYGFLALLQVRHVGTGCSSSSLHAQALELACTANCSTIAMQRASAGCLCCAACVSCCRPPGCQQQQPSTACHACRQACTDWLSPCRPQAASSHLQDGCVCIEHSASQLRVYVAPNGASLRLECEGRGARRFAAASLPPALHAFYQTAASFADLLACTTPRVVFLGELLWLLLLSMPSAAPLIAFLVDSGTGNAGAW